jgi:hypothetical protein
VVLGDAVLGVRDLGLLEHADTCVRHEEVRDVLLKGQLRGFFARHDRAARFVALRRFARYKAGGSAT